MLYIVTHRYFITERILAGLEGRTDVRVVYYGAARLPRSRFGKWLWLADALLEKMVPK